VSFFNLPVYTINGTSVTTLAIITKLVCEYSSDINKNRNPNVTAKGTMKLGSSLRGMLLPLIDAKFDWPRHISFLNMGANALSSPR
jgi:hypothetical protein